LSSMKASIENPITSSTTVTQKPRRKIGFVTGLIMEYFIQENLSNTSSVARLMLPIASIQKPEDNMKAGW